MSKKANKKVDTKGKLTWRLFCTESNKGLALRIILGLLAPYAYLMLCGLVFDRWLRLYGMTTFIFFSYAILQVLGIAVAVLSIVSNRRWKNCGKSAVSVKECVIVCAIVLLIVAGVIAILLTSMGKNEEPRMTGAGEPTVSDVIEIPEADETTQEPVEEATESSEEEKEEEGSEEKEEPEEGSEEEESEEAEN